MTPSCASCGATAPPDAKYCENCGAELGVEPRPVCIDCAEAAVADDGYCGSCGRKQPGERDHLVLQEGIVVAVTDRGLRHSHNEDAVSIAVLAGGGAVLVVCDGVSSTPGSATASQAAADAACERIRSRLEVDPDLLVDEVLVEAVAAAQAGAAAVPTEASSDPRHQGGAPSATLVAAVARPVGCGRITIDTAWVGDSRAYWVSEGEAVALTEDHEIGGGLVRWLGSDSVQPDPEISHLTSERPGRLVVCSDGLWRYVDPAIELARLIGHLEADHPTSDDLARALVDHALAGGGHDNITVAIWDSADEPASVTTSPGEPAATPETQEAPETHETHETHETARSEEPAHPTGTTEETRHE